MSCHPSPPALGGRWSPRPPVAPARGPWTWPRAAVWGPGLACLEPGRNATSEGPEPGLAASGRPASGQLLRVAACAGPAPCPGGGGVEPWSPVAHAGPPAPRVPGSRAAAPAAPSPTRRRRPPAPHGARAQRSAPAHRMPRAPTPRRTHTAPERAGPPATHATRASRVHGRPDPRRPRAFPEPRSAAQAPTWHSHSAICAPRPHATQSRGRAPARGPPPLLPGLAPPPAPPPPPALGAHLAPLTRGPWAWRCGFAAPRPGKPWGPGRPPPAARGQEGGGPRAPSSRRRSGRSGRPAPLASRPRRPRSSPPLPAQPRAGRHRDPALAAHPDGLPVTAGNALPCAQRRERLGVGAAGGAGGKSSRAAWLRSPAPRRPQGRARPDSTPWRPACPLRARPPVRLGGGRLGGGVPVEPSKSPQNFHARLRLGDAAGRGWGDRCIPEQRIWTDTLLSGAPSLWPVL